MRDLRVIDNVLFRKLFASSFSGGVGDGYRITERGVRWRESEDEHTERLPPSFSPTDDQIIAMLEIIRAARLDFPATFREALGWAERNDAETYVPDWLMAAMRANSPEAALAVLSASTIDWDSKVNEFAAAQDWGGERAAQRELREISGVMEAFKSIREQLAGAASSGLQRHAGLAVGAEEAGPDNGLGSPQRAAGARWGRHDSVKRWLADERRKSPGGSRASFIRMHLPEIRERARQSGEPLTGSDQSVVSTAAGWLRQEGIE